MLFLSLFETASVVGFFAAVVVPETILNVKIVAFVYICYPLSLFPLLFNTCSSLLLLSSLLTVLP